MECIIKYKIDFIITKPNLLTKYFKHIVSGLTTIENHDSQDEDYTLNLLSLNNISDNFIQKNVPLISCAHIKSLTNKIIDICNKKSILFILTNFYHLKYIEYDTKLNTRYSYVNIAIALTILDYIIKFYIPKTREFDISSYNLKYKTSSYNRQKVLVGCIPSNLPSNVATRSRKVDTSVDKAVFTAPAIRGAKAETIESSTEGVITDRSALSWA